MKKYLLSLVMIIFTSCSSDSTIQEPLYDWADYEQATVLYGFDNTDKSNIEKYKEELLKIISQPRPKNKKIQPTICAEYGYLLYISGHKESAKMYFDKEVELYPESKHFIRQFVNKLYNQEK